MNYRILVLISKNRLSAINVDKSGNVENISLEGNAETVYSTTDDIDTFCQYIKDYFNINNFGDIDLSIFILNFGAAQSMVNYLFDSLNNVNSLNIVNANIVLPIFALKYFNIKPNTCYNISAFGINHQIFVDNDCICKCNEVNDAEFERELALEDYVNLFEFCCLEIIEDSNINNEIIEDYLKEISKLNVEKQELITKIEHLTISKESEINALKETISALNSQLEKLGRNSISSANIIAEELRNTQEDWQKFEEMILGLIKSDIKLRAENGHSEFSVFLSAYTEKLEENYIKDNNSLGDSEESRIWRKFREQFLMVCNSSFNKGKIYFGANPKILDKLSRSLISKLQSEGFDASRHKGVAGYSAYCKPLWTKNNKEYPESLEITVTW